jgi:EamA domain-containing membrane protein RarD
MGPSSPQDLTGADKKESDMEKTISISDRIAGMVIAVALSVVGVGFMVLGVSLLPVIGIFVGISVLGFAWRFLTPKAAENTRIAGFVIPDSTMFHPGHGRGVFTH